MIPAHGRFAALPLSCDGAAEKPAGRRSPPGASVNALIDRLLAVPYVPGRGDLGGADCWGIVEIWYRECLGIELPDRADHPAGHGGVQAGFDAARHWRAIEAPVNHCLVVMRARGLQAGHVGIFHQGSVLHSDETHGCVFEPIGGRFIRTRISGYLKHL